MAHGAPPRWYSFIFCVLILAACIAGMIYSPHWWVKILCIFPMLYAIFFLVVTFSSLNFIPRRRNKKP